ncbi:FAD-binding oxidoreductase [Tenuibacillus multivorans]|uniref:FAD-binding oxidoreductase n=1 Tax=Tenuibacillus multivorans TaxID=237069 RepID=UPI000B840C0F|nr:FAD-linked oxidase C-terminal domain-containing protein [Tenuibacillus multivorans]
MLDEIIIKEFEDIVGVHNIQDSNATRLAYSYDATASFQSLPDLVVSPRNTEEVAGIVKLCQKHGLPIVPRGSGTNLAAGTTPSQGGVVLIFRNMNDIVELDEENLALTVQPGVLTEEIHQYVEEQGLFYPPDPSSGKISTIGGNISENSGGLRGLKYGVTKDYILALEVVLPNGDIVRTGGKLAKDVAGYDLKSLLVGSEGTLGIVTEATLKLIPKPFYKETMLAVYESLEDAAETVSAILANRIIPATLEFMDQGTIQVVEGYKQIGLPTDCEAILLIEQDGPKEIVEQDIEKMYSICKEYGALSLSKAVTEQEAEELTRARKDALSCLAYLSPTTILEDATVPRSKIAPMVREIKKVADKYDVRIHTFGHAGDGNLHPTCATDARDKEEMARVEEAFAEIFQIAVDMGGTITGEHGVGEMKAPYLEWKVGELGIEIMKAIKQAIDPNNIMNPGKVFAKSTKKRVVVSNV